MVIHCRFKSDAPFNIKKANGDKGSSLLVFSIGLKCSHYREVRNKQVKLIPIFLRTYIVEALVMKLSMQTSMATTKELQVKFKSTTTVHMFCFRSHAMTE